MESKVCFIKALSPGYTKDHKSNVGEFVELFVPEASAENAVPLAGYKLSYMKLGANDATVLVEFAEESYAVGKSIILRLGGTVDVEFANVIYDKQTGFSGINFTGKLVLELNGEVVDEVEWGAKGGIGAFAGANETVLERELGSMEFLHVAESEYEILFDAGNYMVQGETDDENAEGGKGGVEVASQCKGLQFSEILSYYAEAQDEQFVEFYNANSEQVLLDGCAVRYKNKTYPLEGIVGPEGYVVRYATDFKLTKNPTNMNIVELLDTTGEVIDKLEYYNGQRKGTAYAWIGYDAEGKELWKTTYAATPGEANIYQEYRTCEAGKVINEETGNCVKVAVVEEKTCAAGQYLNPLTGRCKKIATASATTCKEGYELNEATGRCKKIVENTGTDYGINVETYTEEASFVAMYAIIGVLVVGLGYVIFEFRKEIAKLFRKVFR